MVYKVTEVIAELYDENISLLEGNSLNKNEKEYYESIRLGMSSEMAESAIHHMAKFMHRYYGKKVIVLLDDLFEGLEVWKDEKYRQFQGTYPVIFLSFAGIKTNSAEGLRKSFKAVI